MTDLAAQVRELTDNGRDLVRFCIEVVNHPKSIARDRKRARELLARLSGPMAALAVAVRVERERRAQVQVAK